MNKCLGLTGLLLALIVAAPVHATKMPPLAKDSGCSDCHAISYKVIGPAWADVAKRYKSKPGSKALLIERVRNGTKGNWTEVTNGVYMPPNYPRVTEENIEKLVEFILTLNRAK